MVAIGGVLGGGCHEGGRDTGWTVVKNGEAELEIEVK